MELKISEIFKDNKSKRIDSEYFKKEYIENKHKLDNLKTEEIQIYAKIADGDHSKLPENQDKEIRYLQARDISNNFLNIVSDTYVSEKYFLKNKRSIIRENDILISIMGNVGDIAIVPKGFTPSICNRAIAIVKDIKNISPQFLFAYLMTKFAFNDIERLKNGGVQQRLNLDVLRQLKIPNMSDGFQLKVQGTVNEALSRNKNSKYLYSKSEQLLLEELDLIDFNPSNENTAIKRLKESFLKTGRLDSEYYQVKYDEVENNIKNYSNGYDLLAKCCNLKDKNYIPKSKFNYKYIELSNIGVNAEINGCIENLGSELPTRARRKVEIGDVIVSSIEGSLDSCALISDEYNNALCSNGFYVLNSNRLNSETLLVIFKSDLMQNLMKKSCSGTILTNISKEEFLNLPIPILKSDVQEEIQGYIKQSIEYKNKAKNLLETSVKSVEIAIDKGEEIAHNFLDRQTDRQTDRQ